MIVFPSWLVTSWLREARNSRWLGAGKAAGCGGAGGTGTVISDVGPVALGS